MKHIHKILSVLLTLALLLCSVPLTAIAEDGGCTHTHNADCGYAEDAPCDYAHTHDEYCGYDSATDSGCTDAHVHGGGCGYIEAVPCGHVHDEDSGDRSPAGGLSLDDSGDETISSDRIVVNGREFHVIYNSYIACYVDVFDGGFAILPKNVEFKADKPLSKTTFLIDGKDYTFGLNDFELETSFIEPNFENGVLETMWKIGEYAISQYHAITKDENQENSYAVKIAYAAEYFGSSSSDISARILLDTQLGMDDDLTFVGENITNEVCLSPAPDELWVESESGFAKAFIDNEETENENAAAPVFVTLADFGALNAADYDYTPDSDSSILATDSAAAVYFETRCLEAATESDPDSSLAVFRTNYGFYELSQDDEPFLSSASLFSAEPVEISYGKEGPMKTLLKYPEQLPESAIPGTTVTLNLELLYPDAYEIRYVNMSIKGLDNEFGEPQPLSPGNPEWEYTFVMPDTPCKIEYDIQLKDGYARIFLVDDLSLATLSPSALFAKVGEPTTITISDALPAGQDVLVTGTTYIYLGAIDGTLAITTEEANKTYTFIAPDVDDIKITVVAGDLYRIRTEIDPTDANVTLTASASYAIKDGIVTISPPEGIEAYQEATITVTEDIPGGSVVETFTGSQLDSNMAFFMPEANVVIRLTVKPFVLYSISKRIVPTDDSVTLNVSENYAKKGSVITIYPPVGIEAYQNAKIIVAENIAGGFVITEFTGDDLDDEMTFIMPENDVEIRLELTAYNKITVSFIDEADGSDMSYYGNYYTNPETPKTGDEVHLYPSIFNGAVMTDFTVYKAGTSTEVSVSSPAIGRDYVFTMPDCDVTVEIELKKPPEPPAYHPIYVRPLVGYGEIQAEIQIIGYNPPFDLSAEVMDSVTNNKQIMAGAEVSWWVRYPHPQYSHIWEVTKAYYETESGVRVDLALEGPNTGVDFIMPDEPITMVIEGGIQLKQLKFKGVVELDGKEYPINTTLYAEEPTEFWEGEVGKSITEAPANTPITIFEKSPAGYKLEHLYMETAVNGRWELTGGKWDGNKQATAFKGESVQYYDATITACYSPIDPVKFYISDYRHYKGVSVSSSGTQTGDLEFTVTPKTNASDGTKHLYNTITINFPEGDTRYTIASTSMSYGGITLEDQTLTSNTYKIDMPYTEDTPKTIIIGLTAEPVPPQIQIDSIVPNHTNKDRFNRIDILGSNFDHFNPETQIYYVKINGTEIAKNKVKVVWDEKISAKKITIDAAGFSDDIVKLEMQLSYTIGTTKWVETKDFTFRLYEFKANINEGIKYIGIAKLKGRNEYELVPGNTQDDLRLDPALYDRMVLSLAAEDCFDYSIATDGGTGKTLDSFTLKSGGNPVMFSNGLSSANMPGTRSFIIRELAAGAGAGVSLNADNMTLSANSIPLLVEVPLMNNRYTMTVSNNSEYSTNLNDVTTKGKISPAFLLPGYDKSVDLGGFGGIGAKYSGIGYLDNAANLSGLAYVQLPAIINKEPLGKINIDHLVLGMNKTPISFDGLKAGGSFSTPDFLLFKGGASGRALIDTFNDQYEFELAADLSFIEFEGMLYLTKSDRFTEINGGNPVVLPDRFYFELEAEQGVPLIPVAQVGEFTGVMGGIKDIVKTLDYDPSKNTIPSVKITAGGKFSLVEVIGLEISLTAGFASIQTDLSGKVDLKGFEIELLESYSQSVGVKDAPPTNDVKRIKFYAGASISINLLKGIIDDVAMGSGSIEVAAYVNSPDALAAMTFDSVEELLETANLLLTLEGNVNATVQIPPYLWMNDPIELFNANLQLYMYAKPFAMTGNIKAYANLSTSVLSGHIAYNFAKPNDIDIGISTFSAAASDALYKESYKDANGNTVTVTLGEGLTLVGGSNTSGNFVQGSPMRFSALAAPLSLLPTVSTNADKTVHTIEILNADKEYVLSVDAPTSQFVLYGPDNEQVPINAIPSFADAQAGSFYNAMSSDSGTIVALSGAGTWTLVAARPVETQLYEGDPRPVIENLEIDEQAETITFNAKNLNETENYIYSLYLEKRATPESAAEEIYHLAINEPMTLDGLGGFAGSVDFNVSDLAQSIPTGDYYPVVNIYQEEGTDDYTMTVSEKGYIPYSNVNTKYAGLQTASNLTASSGGNETIRLRFTHTPLVGEDQPHVGYKAKLYEENGQPVRDEEGAVLEFDIPQSKISDTVDFYVKGVEAGRTYYAEIIPVYTQSVSYEIGGETQTQTLSGFGNPVKSNTVEIKQPNPPALSVSMQNGNIKQTANGTIAYAREDGKLIADITDGQVCDIEITTYVGFEPIKKESGATQLSYDVPVDFGERLIVVTATNADGDAVTQMLTLNSSSCAPALILASGNIEANPQGRFSLQGQTTPHTLVYTSLGSTVKADSTGQFTLSDTISSPQEDVALFVSDDAGNSNDVTVTVTVNSSAIPVTGITVSGVGGATTITSSEGTLQLYAGIAPVNATNKVVSWSVVSGNAATVGSSGIVTATANGTVTIRATAQDGSNVYGEITITVTGQTAPDYACTVTFNGNGGSPAAQTKTVTAPATNVGTLPASPTRANYSFNGWNTAANGTGTAFTATTTVSGNITVYAQWIYTGGGGNGGGSNGGGYTTPAIATAPAEIWLDRTAAATLAAGAKSRSENYARTRNTGIYGVRGNAWDRLAGLRYEHDTMDGSAVQVRVYVKNPEKLTKDTRVSGYIKGSGVDWVKAHFEKWFKNKLRVIHFDHQGAWGQPVEVAAKVDLTGMDTKNLYFYYYDKAANIYRRIDNPGYWIDKNGYLHFTTEYAGDIIISDGPLALKGQN